MFDISNLNDKYSYYFTVKKSALKVGKIFGIIATVLYFLISLIVYFSSSELSSDTIVCLILFLIVFVFMFVQIGKNIVWTYYWDLERSGDHISAIFKSLYLGGYFGFALRLKYHNYGKKIKKEYNK